MESGLSSPVGCIPPGLAVEVKSLLVASSQSAGGWSGQPLRRGPWAQPSDAGEARAWCWFRDPGAWLAAAPRTPGPATGTRRAPSALAALPGAATGGFPATGRLTAGAEAGSFPRDRPRRSGGIRGTNPDPRAHGAGTRHRPGTGAHRRRHIPGRWGGPRSGRMSTSLAFVSCEGALLVPSQTLSW